MELAQRLLVALLATLALTGLAACDGGTSGPTAANANTDASKADSGKKGRAGPPATIITVTKAEARTIEVTEDTVGTVEDIVDPRIAAEVAGRVTTVFADIGSRVKRGQLLAEIDPVDIEIQGRSDRAEIGRLEVLLANQERIVDRNTQLVDRGFISRGASDDAVANRNALREQLASARAKAEATGSNMKKTRVLSPIDGQVEELVVAAGDYVKVGDPLYRLVGTQKMRAHLPFPESAAPRLKPGAPVRLHSPLAPERVIQARVSDIRPSVTPTTRALSVIVAFDNNGTIRGGATVNASVVTQVKSNVILVPEQSVVLRPAGRVVYVVNEGRATQQIVEIGVRQDGLIEIVRGLQGGETLALDGAGFLTGGAAVQVAQADASKGGGRAARQEAGKRDADGKGPAAEPAAKVTGGKS